MIALKNVQNARETIADVVKETPIFTSEQLSAVCGNKLYLKGEHLQKTGSFKIRGATNKVKEVVKKGATAVTAASSGNHGQAVAYIAQRLGVSATIVVPEDANRSKIAAIEAYGGIVEKCGTTSEERIARAKELRGVFIPPYDDPYVIAGQGTIGLEIVEQVPDVDAIIVPIGGGGLISGILTAVKELYPHISVIGVEPASANDTFLSLQKGERVSISTTTIADGLRTSQPGKLTFPIIQKYLDDLILVEEDEIKQALNFVYERMKQVIEPSSAVTIAACMQKSMSGKKIVPVISGGNVDVGEISGVLKVR